MHANRLKKWGDVGSPGPGKRRPITKSTPEEFFGRLTPFGDCLNWPGAKNRRGYGWVNYGLRPQLAHRLAWRLVNGAIPDGMLVCHHCDNRLCCRVEHLFVGTPADNTRDMMGKGRHRCNAPKGEAAGASKITEADVLAIRASSEPSAVVGARFGIDPSNVSCIRRRKTWKHI